MVKKKKRKSHFLKSVFEMLLKQAGEQTLVFYTQRATVLAAPLSQCRQLNTLGSRSSLMAALTSFVSPGTKCDDWLEWRIYRTHFFLFYGGGVLQKLLLDKVFSAFSGAKCDIFSTYGHFFQLLKFIGQLS